MFTLNAFPSNEDILNNNMLHNLSSPKTEFRNLGSSVLFSFRNNQTLTHYHNQVGYFCHAWGKVLASEKLMRRMLRSFGVLAAAERQMKNFVAENWIWRQNFQLRNFYINILVSCSIKLCHSNQNASQTHKN